MENKNNTIIIFLVVAPSILSVLTALCLFDSDSIFLMLLLAFVYLLIFCSVLIIKKPMQKKEEANNLQIRFYKECKTKGIEELSSAANRQKAELIAQKLGCKGYKNFEQYFEESKKLCAEKDKQDRIEKQNAKLASLRNTEEKEYKELTKYSTLEGRNKRVAILKDKQAYYYKQANILRKGMELVINDSQQKEIDWATHGGIASGIAGGAAGLAVAMDAQAKNAQIRAQNKANLEALLPLGSTVWGSAREYEDAAKKMQPLVDEAKIKLVTDTPKDKVLDRLDIKLKDISISQTGAFTVQASVKLRNNFVIFDNIQAVVDGTICADLYQEGNKVGSALLVLPTFGVDKQKTTIKGISLDGAILGVPYEVKFTPYLLWEMEK